MNLSYFFNRLRDVKVRDMLHLFPFLLAEVLRPMGRRRYADLWLVCEEPMEAHDNGYHFFRYLRQTHPEIRCRYAIRRSSPEFRRVADLGDVVEYGSLRHWLMFLCCRYNISSAKGGKPNAAFCAFLELQGLVQVKNIFLQHGITINDVKWLYSNVSRIDYFVTSTTDEAAFIRRQFGYPEGTVRLTGMPRMDALHEVDVHPRQLLVMPTWRYWFRLPSKRHSDADGDVEHSEYLERWRSLLQHPQLRALAEREQLEVLFYPHHNMQPYIHYFSDLPSYVKVASWRDYDIQDLLKTSALMVTDYSSVFFDMVYMKKPVVFYQFDEEKYRQYQYGQGYFDYHNNPFGKTFDAEDDVVQEIARMVQERCAVDEAYLAEHRRLFPFYDTHNSERIFNDLKAGV